MIVVTLPLYECPSCSRTYDTLPQDDLCEECNIPLRPVERKKLTKKEKLSGTSALVPASRLMRGLGMLGCDISYSMEEKAFPLEAELSKLELVTRAIQDAVSQMQNLEDLADAYLAIIAFGRNAQLITDRQGRPFVKSVQEILAEEGDGLGDYLRELFMSDSLGVDRNATNITEALRLARQIMDQALSGSLQSFGVTHQIALDMQTVTRPKNQPALPMPNIRVMFYSDGKHNEGPLENAFATMQPASVLMTAFIGDEKADTDARMGADQMKALANICPKHDRKGYFLINTLSRQAFLREVYHMATGASGFCSQCLIKKDTKKIAS